MKTTGVEFLNATNKYTFQRNKIQNFRSIEIKPRNTTLSYFNDLNNNSKKKTRKRKFTSSKSRNIEKYETRFNNLLSQSAIRRNNVSGSVCRFFEILLSWTSISISRNH